MHQPRTFLVAPVLAVALAFTISDVTAQCGVNPLDLPIQPPSAGTVNAIQGGLICFTLRSNVATGHRICQIDLLTHNVPANNPLQGEIYVHKSVTDWNQFNTTNNTAADWTLVGQLQGTSKGPSALSPCTIVNATNSLMLGPGDHLIAIGNGNFGHRYAVGSGCPGNQCASQWGLEYSGGVAFTAFNGPMYRPRVMCATFHFSSIGETLHELPLADMIPGTTQAPLANPTFHCFNLRVDAPAVRLRELEVLQENLFFGPFQGEFYIHRTVTDWRQLTPANNTLQHWDNRFQITGMGRGYGEVTPLAIRDSGNNNPILDRGQHLIAIASGATRFAVRPNTGCPGNECANAAGLTMEAGGIYELNNGNVAASVLAGALRYEFLELTSYTLPAANRDVEGSTATAEPWTWSTPRRLMAAYDGAVADLTSPVRIGGIRLRHDLGNSIDVAKFNLQLDVSTGRSEAAGLHILFDVNHGADRLRVFDNQIDHWGRGGISSPAEGTLHIPFDTMFEWDPRSGPLILDFHTSGTALPSNVLWDAESGSGLAMLVGSNQASFAFGPATATAPVVEIVRSFDVAPAQQEYEFSGSGTSPDPWYSTSPLRRMEIFGPAEFDFVGRRRIHALNFVVTTSLPTNAVSRDLEISMSTKTSPAQSFGPTFASNHGPDRKVVFDGVLDIPSSVRAWSFSRPAEFRIRVPLAEPFDYDPSAGPLVIDYRLRGATGQLASSGYIAGTSGNDIAVLVAGSANATTPTTTFSMGGPTIGLETEPAPTIPSVAQSTTRLPSSWPWNQPTGGQARVQSLYPAHMIGASSPIFIQHLRWRPSTRFSNTFGPAHYTCVIYLSTNPVTSLGMTFDSNHGGDREQVFYGSFSVPYIPDASDPELFPIEVKLDSPFFYDPSAGGLIVDIGLIDTTGFPGPAEVVSHSLPTVRVATSTSISATTASLASSYALLMRVDGTSANALSENYGVGCPGSYGFPLSAPRSVHLAPATLPSPDFAVGMVNGPPLSGAFLLIGISQTTTPLLPFGAPGCDILTGNEIGALFTFTDVTGYAQVALPLPDPAVYAGFPFFTTQYAALDLNANQLGAIVSDAQKHTPRF